ncbi:MAG: site-specific DNA-methyltransferase [Treponema sp.]|nr:site-specific DNA-methyltransferase [Treponema sp.]
MDHLKMHSMNKIDENIAKIAQFFPNCVTEAKGENGEITHKIDFDMLKQELSHSLVEGREERYQFTWPDKKQAILTANAPINKTLRPCREESVNFDETENLYIEGDNLEVLKLLQETYLGKIKMIYIDPPYNTGNDFVYNDDFRTKNLEFREKSGNFDEEGYLLVDNYTRNTESNGRFHTDWLNMMYPRLKLARDLLSDDGVIFISIDDNEVENLKKVCDEIFGASNFVANIIWQKKTSSDARMDISAAHDYILCFTKNRNLEKYLFNYLPYDEERLSNYTNPDNDPRGDWASVDITGQTGRAPKSQFYEIITPSGMKYFPPEGRCWAMAQNTFEQLYKDNRLWFGSEGKNRPRLKKFLSESEGQRPWTWWDNKFASYNQASNKELMKLFDGKLVFDNPKPTKLLKRMISLTTKANEKDIILDFFSGSCSTADAVMQLNQEENGNRRFICIQLPQDLKETGNDFKANNVALSAGFKNICEIGKERIRRAGQQILKQVQNDKEKSHTDSSLLTQTLFSNEEEKSLDFSNPCDNSGGVAGVSPAEGVAENAQAVGARGRLPPSDNYTLDIGFRVLKCDTSNMEDVYYTPDHINTNDLFKNNIKSDRTPEDLLFQVMLDLGIMLSSKIQTKQIDGKTVYYVEGKYLVACFDEDVTEETITKIAKEKPYYFVMRDPANSKDGDSLITNFEQIFTTYSPETIRKVL